MVLMYWWMLLLWGGFFAVVFVLYRKGRLNRWQSKREVVKVAHSRRITELPEYTEQKARYRRWLIVLLVVAVTGLLSAAVLSSRPAAQSIVSPAQTNRDIVLCLDVSGSMKSVDVKLVETFQKLMRDFKGQRIGLDLFNYNNSQAFPLTDDYELVAEQLTYVKKILSIDETTATDEEMTEYYNALAGTSSTGLSEGNGDGGHWAPSSNVGVGLAGCAQHFGENLSGRSQSIMLATDNELGGVEEDAIITTKQAMMLAKKDGIRVYSIDPGVYNSLTGKSDPNIADNYSSEHAVLRTYSLTTGGGYYRLSSTDIVPDIIAKVSQQEAKLFVGDSQYAASDVPLPGFIVLFVSVVGIALVSWRLKL